MDPSDYGSLVLKSTPELELLLADGDSRRKLLNRESAPDVDWETLLDAFQKQKLVIRTTWSSVTLSS